MANELRALDATDQKQIIVALQEWINGLTDPDTESSILDDIVYLEFQNGNFGYCIKSMGGAVTEEYINGNFSAEIRFGIYLTTNAVPVNDGSMFEPLNNLSAWFRKNGTSGLDIGDRRVPDEITTLNDATHLSGPDEQGNVTFVSTFGLTYDEKKGE